MAKDLTDEELFSVLASNQEPAVSAPEQQSPSADVSDEELFDILAGGTFGSNAADLQQKEEQYENLKDHGGAIAAARGAIQGVTLGFSDEIEGAIKAGVAKMEGDERDYSEIYTDKRDQARKENAISREISPFAFGGAEFAGAIPTVLAGGPVTAGLRGAALLGGVTGVGMSNRTGSELAQDALIGATLGVAGEKVFKGVGNRMKQVFSNTKNPIVKEAMSELGETRLPKNLEFERATVRDIWTGNYKSADEWLMSKSAAKRAVEGMDETPDIVNTIIRNEKQILGEQLDMMTRELTDQGVTLNARPAVERLKEKLSVLTETNAVKQIRKKYLDGLNITEVSDDGLVTAGFKLGDGSYLNLENMSLKEAHLLKRRIANETYSNKDPSNIFKQDKEASKALKEFTDEIINEFNATSKDIAEINNKFKQIYDIEELGPKKADDFFILTDKLNTSERAKELREFVLTARKYDELSGSNILNSIVTEVNPRLKLFDAVNSVQNIVGNNAVAKGFQVRAAASIAGPVGGVLALGKGALFQSAQALSRSVKLPRTTAGVFRNYEVVLDKLNRLSPALAVTFNDAVISEDYGTVEQMMSEAAAQFPEEFEPGAGFEGKLHPIEQEQMTRQVKADTSLSTRQKLQAITQIRAGQLPQPTQPEQPFFKQYQPRPRNADGRKL